jgi:hypothetical protein
MRLSCNGSVRLLLKVTLISAAAISSARSLAFAQGETTSAILGQVTDPTNAVVSGATLTILNRDTGMRRSARTDEAGRFNFPQLNPGTYAVRAEAEGFEPQQINNVFPGLGHKQTVNLTLGVAQSKQIVEVNAEAPIINPGNANTATTLKAAALEDLPNQERPHHECGNKKMRQRVTYCAAGPRNFRARNSPHSIIDLRSTSFRYVASRLPTGGGTICKESGGPK